MIYILLIIAVFTAEYFIKEYVEKHFSEHQNKKALGGFILTTKYHNEGACLDAGSSKKALVKWISVGLTMALTILFIVTLGKKGKTALKLGLAFLLGGAYSNTYDRIKRKYVVDYFRINAPFESIRKVIFNISDFFIMIGALIVALQK